MSCCGKKRANLAARSSPRPERFVRGPMPAAQPAGEAVIEYVGATSLIVRGPASGRVYRFFSRGARLAVDARDAASLLAVPHLRRAS